MLGAVSVPGEPQVSPCPGDAEMVWAPVHRDWSLSCAPAGSSSSQRALSVALRVSPASEFRVQRQPEKPSRWVFTRLHCHIYRTVSPSVLGCDCENHLYSFTSWARESQEAINSSTGLKWPSTTYLLGFCFFFF